MIEFHKHHPDTTALLWVVLAVDSPKGCRDHLQCLYLNDYAATDTDGHRLHTATLENKYEPGLYRIIKKSKTELILAKSEHDIDRFPDYQRVIIPASDQPFELDSRLDSALAQTIRLLPETLAVNIAYFNDALLPSSSLSIGQASADTDRFTLRLDSPGRTAIIMPLSIQGFR